MKNLNVLVIMFALISLVACRPNLSANNTKDNKIINAKQLVQDLVYIKDDKSGLCFAYAWHGGNYDNYGGPVFTEVSCEKVEKLLVK